MRPVRRATAGGLQAAALLAAVALAALATRPLIPLDETRFAAVAWEMWRRGDWLVPHLNAEPYSHKGPALFWLLGAGWAAFGVSDWWPRLLPALCALASLALTARLARMLWPERPWLAGRAALLLVGFAAFSTLSTVLLTDALLHLAVVGAITAVAWSWRRGGALPWLVFAAALGLGALTKGPAVVLHCVPLALLAPWWAIDPRPRSWPRWYAGAGAATAGGLAIALVWALAAARAGGPEYADAILWRQTAGRVAASFAHARPWWFYFALAPALLLPYPLWPRLWRAGAALARQGTDAGARFCLVWFVVPLASFSLVSGKQPHYLFPELAALALLGARALEGAQEDGRTGDRLVAAVPLLIAAICIFALPLVPLVAAALQRENQVLALLRGAPWWLGVAPLALAGWILRRRQAPLDLVVRDIALAISAVAVVVHFAAVRPIAPVYRTSEIGALMARAENEGRRIAYAGHYEGQLHFASRLRTVPEEIESGEIAAWLGRHPDGLAIAETRLPPVEVCGLEPFLARPYRGRILAAWMGSGDAEDASAPAAMPPGAAQSRR